MNKIFNAECFIIPNKAGYCSEFLLDSYRERYIRHSTDLCKQKGIEFDPDKDKLVQVWFHSDDLESDNLNAHGFEMGGCCYDFSYGFVPYPLLKDIKEGDKMDLQFEVETYNETLDEDVTEQLTLHITFEQLPFRYGRFGKFEDVLRKVV